MIRRRTPSPLRLQGFKGCFLRGLSEVRGLGGEGGGGGGGGEVEIYNQLLIRRELTRFTCEWLYCRSSVLSPQDKDPEIDINVPASTPVFFSSTFVVLPS